MVGLTSLIAAAALAAAPADAADHPVQIGHGAQALHGSLMQPAHVTSHAAVLLVGGSGPDDRDGNDLKDGERDQALRLLAMALAERGVLTLRYDKRGVGESAAAGDATSVQQLAGDAGAWARFLKGRPGVRCVVVLGHSEGVLIGSLAAQQVKLCGLVSVAGESRQLGDVIEDQAALLRTAPEVRAKIHAAVLALRAGQPVPEVPPGYDRLFGPGAVDYTRSEISIDPVAELARVKAPVLVVQGDNDLQASVASAQRLAAAAHVQPVIIPGMTHALKFAPPKDIRANIDTYRNPDLPLAPGLAQAIGDFVTARR
jgi:pimeloyl-ACP methyl ester carboxylesterase